MALVSKLLIRFNCSHRRSLLSVPDTIVKCPVVSGEVFQTIEKKARNRHKSRVVKKLDTKKKKNALQNFGPAVKKRKHIKNEETWKSLEQRNCLRMVLCSMQVDHQDSKWKGTLGHPYGHGTIFG